VQVYEDAKGQPVIAVTYWKFDQGAAARTKKAEPVEAEPQQVEDHTDDLYFTKPGAKLKRNKAAADPNQLDLFGSGRRGGDEGGSP
jgi:hypothetical protein